MSNFNKCCLITVAVVELAKVHFRLAFLHNNGNMEAIKISLQLWPRTMADKISPFAQ